MHSIIQVIELLNYYFMRIASILLLSLLCCVALEAQQTTDYAVRLIKIGNTYR